MFRAVLPAYRPFWVLAISGVLGFRVGMIGFPTWQIAVESAQVVAGLVQYPPDNPFYIYHTKLWSLVIQVCALLLRAGVSEITLSLALSGLLGMISFQALSMVIYAIGGSASLAIGGAFVVFLSRITDHGVVYPVFLLGHSSHVRSDRAVAVRSRDRAARRRLLPNRRISPRRGARRARVGWHLGRRGSGARVRVGFPEASRRVSTGDEILPRGLCGDVVEPARATHRHLPFSASRCR